MRVEPGRLVDVAVAAPGSGAGVLDDVVPLEYPSGALVPEALVDARVPGEAAVGAPVRAAADGAGAVRQAGTVPSVDHRFFLAPRIIRAPTSH